MTLRAVEQLCRLNCTDAEIAAFFHVSPAAITQRKHRDKKFAATIERGKNKGRLSVRRAQMRLLNKGNASIAIWLGKQLLDQKDKLDHHGTQENRLSVQVNHEISAALSEYLDELRAFCRSQEEPAFEVIQPLRAITCSR